MRVDWRLVSTFAGVGAYFIARFFGASVLIGAGAAVVVALVVYGAARARRGGPRAPGPAA